MGPMGFEPMAIRLKAECSTTELRTHYYYTIDFKNPQILFGKNPKIYGNGIQSSFKYGNILVDK
jgi:hypothetical protein